MGQNSDYLHGAYVQGNVGSGETENANPIPIGGVFNTTAPTVTTGQRVELQTDARGNLLTQLRVPGAAADIAAIDGNSDARSAANNALMVASYQLVFNGATWDRVRSYVNQAATFTGIGVSAAITMTTFPMTKYSLQKIVTGTFTALTVTLEGSLDNTNWFSLASSTTTTNDLIFATDKPVFYIRINCSVFTGGTNVVVNILGTK